MAQACVAFAVANPSHYRVMFLPEVKESAESTALHSAADHAFNILLQRVAATGPRGSALAQQECATTVWSGLHGLALLAIDGVLERKLPDAQSFIENACRSFVGIAFGDSRG